MARQELGVTYWVTIFALGVTASALLAEGYHREKRNGKVYKVTTIKERPYVELKDPNGSGNDNFSGFIPKLLKMLSEALNFQYELHLVKDKAYGTKQADNSWNGMMGEVLRKEADLIAAPITISSERAADVDFTESFMNVGNIVLMRKDLVSGIKNASDLANQDDIKFGVVKDGVTQAFFNNSKINIYKKMWQKMSKDAANLVQSSNIGVQKVRDESYAFITESTTADYWKGLKPCNLVTVGDMINSNGHAFATRREDSAFNDRLSAEIKKMREDGRIQLMKQDYWKQECPLYGSAGVPACHSLALFVGVVVSLWKYFSN